MLSTSLSQVPVLLTQRVVDAYQVVRSKFGPSYQPLSQDGRVIAPIEGKSSEGGFLASRRVKFLAWSFGIVLFCAAILSYPSWSGSTQSITESTPEQTITPPLRTSITKDQYISAVIEAPVAGLFDPEPIREKRSNTKFQEGLVWHCDNLSGGVGNMVSMFLNCVRYAMEAGATTLILPRIDPRSDNLINFGENPAIDLSNVFDVDYFLESWKSACPQMRAVVSDSELSNLPDIKEAPHLAPAQVKKFPRRKYLVVDPAGWREAFDAWMVKTQKFTKMTAETPVRIWQGRVMFQWNREVHSVKFANAFPRLFRFPQKTQRLAGEVLWSLEQKMGSPAVSDVILSTTRESSQRANSLEPGRLVPNAFLGAHLRVAADAVNAKWPGYEAQAPAFIAEAKQRNISNIYLATGSAEHRTRFRKDAEIEGLNVFVKEDLLDEEQLKELQSWTWDQQALVDFDVLMHSSYFYGAVRSSFSWWLAIRRNTLPDAGKRIGTDTDFIKDEKRKDEFRDELSAVVGRYCCINPEGIWS